MKPIRVEFSNAVAQFGQGDLSSAKKTCLKILKKDKTHSDSAHLLALIYKQEGNFQQAKKYFQSSLTLNRNQPVVLSNYGNLLVSKGRYVSAEKHYRTSVRIDSKHIDGWYNLAVLLNLLERFEEAVEHISKAIELNPNDAKYFNTLGIALREQEDFSGAESAFDTAMSLAPANSKEGLIATQNKGLTYRYMHRPELAVSCMEGLISRNIVTPEIAYIKACAHYDAGQYNLAENDLQLAIKLNPYYVAAHESLNKLYWEQSIDEKFLSSYRVADLNKPESAALSYSYAAQLIQSDQNELAQQVLQNALNIIGPDAGFYHALGVLCKRLSQQEASDEYINKAVKMQPDVVRFRIDKASSLIQHQQYKAALTQLQHAGKINPLDQEVWAYKGLCWRLLGDERAEWLNDYDRLVKVQDLEVPNGYDDLEHFMHELEKVLDSSHKTNRQPLDQSVKNGTQTVGKLLTVSQGVIQDYRKTLDKSVRNYLASLPVDNTHPFLKRNVGDFFHTGSWSVKLNSEGFHSNHMHPQGWLSNCTYVSLPSEIHSTDSDNSGWIKFGETSLELGELEHIGKLICPKKGQHVLFPSYLWHGTVPFQSNHCRITIPSDISPKPTVMQK